MSLLSAFSTKPTPTQPKAAAFIADTDTAAGAARVLGRIFGEAAMVLDGASGHALTWLAQAPTPGILLIELSDCDDPAARLDELAGHCAPGTHVIGLGRWNDIGLYRRLIAMGLDDYLTLPASEDDVAGAIERLNRTSETASGGEAAAGHRVVVVGVRGGVGATTVATGLAWQLSREGRRTALLDLDLAFGSSALALDHETDGGLVEALSAPERMDTLMLSRAATRIDDHLTLYGGLRAPELPQVTQPEALERLLELMDQDYATVVVDLPRHLVAEHSAAIAGATGVVLVAEPNLVGLRDAERMKTLFATIDSAVPVHFMLNKVRGGSERELDPGLFAKQLKQKPLATLPFEGKLAVQAAAKAEPLPAVAGRRSPLARGFKALGERFTAELANAKRAG